MKKFVWLSLLMAAMMAATAVNTNAQTAPLGIRSHVPFDFIVGDTMFRSGTVATYGTSFSQNSGPFSITNFTSKQNVRRIGQRMIGTDVSDDAKLVFRRYGNRYYLAEVWVPGYRGWAIEMSDMERAESQMSMSRTTRPRMVTIVADVM